ncbi:hypothetical protein N665_0497s0024 [Sinapis alba]|nr:hypothetical protein N665_0497s0024 [Sinapis alba]
METSRDTNKNACLQLGSNVFTNRYAFQTAVHTIWRESNRRKHREVPTPSYALELLIDKIVRNRLSLLRNSNNKRFGNIMLLWLGSR